MSEGHKVSKEKVALKRGAIIKLDGVEYLLKEFLSSSEILLKQVENNSVHVRRLSEVVSGLMVGDSSKYSAPEDILSIPKHLMKIAKKRFAAIEPLLQNEQIPSSKEIKIRAAKIDVHYTTLYRWLKAYSSSQSLV